MPLNMQILSVIAANILGLVFISFIVSNALPIWSRLGDNEYEQTIGLWGICSSSLGVKVCRALSCPIIHDDSSFCSKILSARAFITLACILSGISTFCLILCAAKNDNRNRILLLATKGVIFVSLVAGIIGVVVGINGATTHISKNGIELNLGAAAIIGIIGIVVNFGGAIVSLFIK